MPAMTEGGRRLTAQLETRGTWSRLDKLEIRSEYVILCTTADTIAHRIQLDSG